MNRTVASNANTRATNGVSGASSSGGPGPRQPSGSGRRRGLSKAALGKAKLAAMALSAVAFVGSLFGVVRATPNYVTTAQAGSPAVVAPAPAQLSQFAPLPQAPSFTAPSFTAPQAPQAPTFRPLVRSRGS